MTVTKPPIGEVPITTFLAWECQCDSVRRAHGHDGRAESACAAPGQGAQALVGLAGIAGALPW